MKSKIKDVEYIPESSVGVETDVQAGEEKGGRGEHGLTQTKGQAGASAKRPWQFLHHPIRIA